MTVDASCRLLLLFLSGSLQESMLWRTLHSFSNFQVAGIKSERRDFKEARAPSEF